MAPIPPNGSLRARYSFKRSSLNDSVTTRVQSHSQPPKSMPTSKSLKKRYSLIDAIIHEQQSRILDQFLHREQNPQVRRTENGLSRVTDLLKGLQVSGRRHSRSTSYTPSFRSSSPSPVRRERLGERKLIYDSLQNFWTEKLDTHPITDPEHARKWSQTFALIRQTELIGMLRPTGQKALEMAKAIETEARKIWGERPQPKTSLPISPLEETAPKTEEANQKASMIADTDETSLKRVKPSFEEGDTVIEESPFKAPRRAEQPKEDNSSGNETSETLLEEGSDLSGPESSTQNAFSGRRKTSSKTAFSRNLKREDSAESSADDDSPASNRKGSPSRNAGRSRALRGKPRRGTHSSARGEGASSPEVEISDDDTEKRGRFKRIGKNEGRFAVTPGPGNRRAISDTEESEASGSDKDLTSEERVEKHHAKRTEYLLELLGSQTDSGLFTRYSTRVQDLMPRIESMANTPGKRKAVMGIKDLIAQQGNYEINTLGRLSIDAEIIYRTNSLLYGKPTFDLQVLKRN
jgi:hypothetical protein